MNGSGPVRVVKAEAPIRICDIGGWTDTWFAQHGSIFNIAVSPCAEVEITVHPVGSLPERVVIDAANYGERYGFGPGSPPARHPLLEAAIDEMGVPDGASLEIHIFSGAPAGGSTGTSAAVTVALVGALDALTPGRMTKHEVATAAHQIEVDRLGIESGIQDQLCAAYGGLNYIEMTAYPFASVTQLSVSTGLRQALEQRLVLVFLGRTHVSSEVHQRVIADLSLGGDGSATLDELRLAAREARDAVLDADLPALGRAMNRNTDAQRRLHPDLVSKEAQRVIDLAADFGALGTKVNGAGGEGGSLTLLCGGDPSRREDLVRAVLDADPLFRVVPIEINRKGLSVWQA